MNKTLASLAAAGALFLMLPAASAYADAPPGKGNADGTNDGPNKPTSVGTVSQFAHALNDAGGSLGQHSSSFAPGQNPNKPENGGATGRLGVGNVARVDQFPGSNPNDHLAGQTTMDGLDSTGPNLPPGNNDNPNRGNPNDPAPNAAFVITP